MYYLYRSYAKEDIRFFSFNPSLVLDFFECYMVSEHKTYRIRRSHFICVVEFQAPSPQVWHVENREIKKTLLVPRSVLLNRNWPPLHLLHFWLGFLLSWALDPKTHLAYLLSLGFQVFFSVSLSLVLLILWTWDLPSSRFLLCRKTLSFQVRVFCGSLELFACD